MGAVMNLLLPPVRPDSLIESLVWRFVVQPPTFHLVVDVAGPFVNSTLKYSHIVQKQLAYARFDGYAESSRIRCPKCSGLQLEREVLSRPRIITNIVLKQKQSLS